MPFSKVFRFKMKRVKTCERIAFRALKINLSDGRGAKLKLTILTDLAKRLNQKALSASFL